MAISSFSTFYDAFIVELQNQRPDLTDVEIGSINDVLAGVFAAGVTEVTATLVDEFKKTFFATANGPEITLGADDLQTLAVDHFGSAFARPDAVKATGTVQFSRANTDEGNCTIPAGTIVKTVQNAAGTSVRFETVLEVEMTGLTVNASVRAVVAGVSGNAAADAVTQIETTLTDPSIIVNNDDAFAGGAEAENDEEYRDTIRLLLESLKGGTLAAIEATALTVAGVELATGIESLQSVIEWDLNTNLTVGDYFLLPRAKLYIADANGTASDLLVSDVQTAINVARAAGVRVDVIAAIALSLNWSASLTLNPAGPNYTELSSDTSLITDLMTKYLQELGIGTGFSREAARLYILAKFGAAGTNDLTNFATVTPSGDVTGIANQKIIPGTMSTV